jgi:hypothetical protein
LKLKYVCPNDWDWGSCRPSIKYKQEVKYGEKMVGNDRVASLKRKQEEVIRFRLNLSSQRSGVTGLKTDKESKI